MDAKDKLIAGLQEDLANEYAAIIMYRTYASMVGGPFRQELKAFFENEIPDELGHAQFLADKLVSLGAAPVVQPTAVPVTSDPREMLEYALAAEVDTIRRYTQRISESEAAGEIAIKIQLEDLIVDETGHRDEIRKMLRGWR